MLFNSLEFLVFFPVAVAVLFSLPHRFRRFWLLACSLFFYMSWSPVFILLILYSTTIDYFVAKKLDRTEGEKARKWWLGVSLVTNFGALFFFKYYNFFIESWASARAAMGLPFEPPLLHVILPVGISFYTFEAISYTIDVYRRRHPAERDYARLLLFILFFPKLIAGPIERAGHLIPQFERKLVFDYDRVASGLRLMLWGFFKKLVIADRLTVYVDQVYGAPGDYNGTPVLLATYFFAFQIFCDFSAYSDIAIGAARVMGYDLLENFRRPYLARSIKEFWGRWHISLSTWFRDYLYIPLGGNRVSRRRWYWNLVVVFLVSGFWHGANWTFVVWGGLHGFYQVFGLMTAGARDRAWGAVARAAETVRAFPTTLRAVAVPGLSPAGIPAGAAPVPAGTYLASSSATLEGGPAHAAGPGGAPRAPLGEGGVVLPPYLARLRSVLAALLTFHLAVFAWIFFRAGSLSDAFQVIGGIFGRGGANGSLNVALGYYEIGIGLAAIVVMECVHLVQEGRDGERILASLPAWARWGMYYALAVAILMFGQFKVTQFIYFQF